MKQTKKLALCAVLIALALALSCTERLIPLQLFIPLPGVKLGLANVVSLVSLYLLGWKPTFAIVVLRCILGAMFGGGVTGFLFSLTGGLLAMGTMCLSKAVALFSIYGVSILGAAAHHVGQIMVAMLVMHSGYVLAYLPYLLLVALFTGFATGALSGGILRALPTQPAVSISTEK